MSDKVIAENRVRLYIGKKGGTEEVLRLTDSEQYEDRYNWFQPTDAKGILTLVAKVTGKGGQYEGMKFDSVYTEELEKNKGEVYVGYFKSKIGRGIQIRRASTGAQGEFKPRGSTRDIVII